MLYTFNIVTKLNISIFYLCYTVSSKKGKAYPMQINSIEKNNFEGNFINSKRIKGAVAKHFNEVIKYPIDGVTNEELLAKKTFDVFVTNTGAKRVKRPYLAFQSKFKYLNNDIQSENVVVKGNARIDDGVEDNARRLREHILNVDAQKKRENGFNTRGEQIKSYFKMVFGIR